MNRELERPEFWAAHYNLVAADEDHESGELVEPLFGLGAKAVEEYYFRTLRRPASKTAPLWLPLPGGLMVGVEYADCADSGVEVRFLINSEAWDKPELLGYHSPHFALPAFRWDELETIHRMLATTDSSRAAAAALLLFPSVYVTDAEDPATTHTRLVTWWSELQFARPRSVEALASNSAAYLSNPDLRWSLDPDLGWVNDGKYSFRNPQTQMCLFDPRRFSRVKEFMAEVERR